MREIITMILRALRSFGIRPAADYVRRTIAILRWSYLPIYFLGLLAPWYLQAHWPAWIAIIWCGFAWFLFEARVLIPGVVAKLLPDTWLQKINLTPPSGDVLKRWSYNLSTIGMWTLVPLLVAALLPLWGGWYLIFLGLTMMILYVVATAEANVRFWRKALGWSLFIIALLVILGTLVDSRQRIFTSLPTSLQTMIQSISRFGGAKTEQGATQTDRATATAEIDASMTIIEVTEDTVLYAYSAPQQSVPTVSTNLPKGTRLALSQPKADLAKIGAEPAYEVIVGNSENDFINPVNRGYVVARKVRPTSPIPTVETEDEPTDWLGWTRGLDPMTLLILSVGLVVTVWLALKIETSPNDKKAH